MKAIRVIGYVLMVVGLLSAVISIIVQSGYSVRAVQAQRVKQDAASDAFGGEPTPVGSPQWFIIDDPKAFIPHDGKVKWLDDSYLEAHQIYPLQLKTVRFIGGTVEYVGFGAAFIGLIAVLLVRGRIDKIKAEELKRKVDASKGIVEPTD